MKLVVELIPDVEDGGYTARIADIPAYGEGKTEQQAIDDLKEAIRGYIEAFGLEDALSRISSPTVREFLAEVLQNDIEDVENLDHLFTTERLTQIDRAAGQIAAGQGLTMEKADAELRRRRDEWLRQNT